MATKTPPKKPARSAPPQLEGTAALQALEQLRDEDVQPVYFVYGKERYLVDRALELLKKRTIDPAMRDFNYELFQGKEGAPERIINAARTLPMMANRRLVLVRDLDSMKADEQAKLIPYLEAPVPECCLVLEAEKLDSRTRFGAAVKKLAACVKLEPLYERHLVGFVRSEAQRRELRFESGAAELLCDEIGADLGALADTVERLSLLARSRGEGAVTAADVETQVPGARQRTVFELADAVGRGDRPRALRIVAGMMDGKESGVRVVAMLARHVRQLWSADGLLRNKTPKHELASALGIPPFFVDGIVEQARRVSQKGEHKGEAAFRSLHEALFRADLELKSSRLEEARIMERLVLELTA